MRIASFSLPVKVGKSCVVHVSGQPRRFAQIAYVGPTQFGARPGQDCWVGVVYEEAVGKNDGSLEGKRYSLLTSPTV